MVNIIPKHIQKYLPHIFLIMGLTILAYSLSQNNMFVSFGVIALPFFILFILTVIYRPYIGLFTLFIFNYFFIGILRYINIEKSSVVMDIFLFFMIIALLINTIAGKDIPWQRINNKLFYISLIWMGYVFLELFNPSAMFEAWIYNRGAVYNFTILTMLTAVIFNKVKYIKKLFFILSILTSLAIIKVFWQKAFGFDAYELRWLVETDSQKTHIIASGIRYFSFFSDAGNFGSNMGCAMVIYLILSLYISNPLQRIYYFIISCLAGYAMMLSGTRGAMIVPLGGMAMFVLLNKNTRYIVTGGILLLITYVFFAHTYILESNQQIRRMRSAFRPSKDASYLVRKNNQALLAGHMKNKPFGEGVGLAGVENRRFSHRFTTMIPTDSHFVNVWVQYGVVGLCLHISILLFVTIYSGYLIMFRIKNRELKGYMIAMNCGLWGITLSAYGNNFFLQYPTGYMVYIFQTFLVLGESFDKELAENNEQKHLETTILS